MASSLLASPLEFHASSNYDDVPISIGRAVGPTPSMSWAKCGPGHTELSNGGRVDHARQDTDFQVCRTVD